MLYYTMLYYTVLYSGRGSAIALLAFSESAATSPNRSESYRMWRGIMILRNSKWIGPQSLCSGETGANFIERPIEMPRKMSRKEKDLKIF